MDYNFNVHRSNSSALMYDHDIIVENLTDQDGIGIGIAADNNSMLTPPIEFLQVNQRSLNCIIAYSVLFLFAATGNLAIFLSIITNNYNRSKDSRSSSSRPIIGSKAGRGIGIGIGSTGGSRCYSKITILMLNLSIADLIVTFFLMPMEIFWRMTVKWIGGNVLCKTCQFGRAFGLYLSSMIIICISLDRYFAIMFPMKLVDGRRRIRQMLIVAWIAAAVCSAPQSFIFSVKSHPVYTTFEQCVSIGYLSQDEEIIYNIFSVFAMYFVPIIVIIFTYSMVLCKIVRKTNQHQRALGNVNNSLKYAGCHKPLTSVQISTNPNGEELPSNIGKNSQDFGENESKSRPALQMLNVHELLKRMTSTNSSVSGQMIPDREQSRKEILTLRTSDNGVTTYSRARTRTLRLTLMIVLVFLVCSVPYVFMTLWYMFDRKTAEQVDGRIQDGFFMMVVANSCMNPLIYGSFSKNCNVFWWFNCFGSKSKKHSFTSSLKSLSHQPLQAKQTTSSSSSSFPLNSSLTYEAAAANQRYFAKHQITRLTSFLRRSLTSLSLTGHHFHNNIILSHHQSTLNNSQLSQTQQSSESEDSFMRRVVSANTMSTMIPDSPTRDGMSIA